MHNFSDQQIGQMAQREVVRWGYKRMADLRMSTTDPDASPMYQKNKSASRLGYQTHYVVDGGKARVILDVIAPPPGELFSETNDNSVAILLTYGTARLLLASDAEAREEEYMANSPYTGPLTVVKV
jgi:beta-lactamase superfamily II metal-dependent hydrolase